MLNRQITASLESISSESIATTAAESRICVIVLHIVDCSIVSYTQNHKIGNGMVRAGVQLHPLHFNL